jgi:hypothetical protein
MNPHPDQTLTAAPDPVQVLLGRVYVEAPTPLKRRLLAHLLKPLGLLSLATVCNGAFANLAINRDWSHMGIRPELAQSLDAEQVRALTGYVQQVNWEAVTNVSQLLTNSPVLQGSVAASALLALLIKRAREQPKPSQRDLEDFVP